MSVENPRQQVLSRMKNAGMAAAVIDYAEKNGYGRDASLWEFADMLGLVSEVLRFPEGDNPSVKSAKITELHEYACKHGFDKDSALFEFADMLCFVVERSHKPNRSLGHAQAIVSQQEGRRLRIVIPLATLLVISGWMVLEAERMPTLQVGIAMLLGVALGVCGVALKLHMDQADGDGDNQCHHIDHCWTDAEFTQAVQGVKTKLSARTLEACRYVLIDGVEVNDAAKKMQIMTAQLSRALRLLYEQER